MARKPSQNQQADFSFRLQEVSRKSKHIFHNSSFAIVREAEPRRRAEMTSQQRPREVQHSLLSWSRIQSRVISDPSGLKFSSLHHSSNSQEPLANIGLFGFCFPTRIGNLCFSLPSCLGDPKHYRLHKDPNSKSPPCFPHWLILYGLAPHPYSSLHGYPGFSSHGKNLRGQMEVRVMSLLW